jgi:hypothetical protein
MNRDVPRAGPPTVASLRGAARKVHACYEIRSHWRAEPTLKPATIAGVRPVPRPLSEGVQDACWVGEFRYRRAPKGGRSRHRIRPTYRVRILEMWPFTVSPGAPSAAPLRAMMGVENGAGSPNGL